MTLNQLDTPSLIVDVDKLERNLRRMQDVANRSGVRLRPHTKTHKSPDIARMQVDIGAGGITVAKLSEALVMADAGFEDILITCPVYGQAKWEKIPALLDKAQATFNLDSLEVAEGLSAVGAKIGKRLRVYLEVDCGVGRCGVPTDERVLPYAEAIAKMKGVELVGILAWGGQAYSAHTPTERKQIGTLEGEIGVRVAKMVREHLGAEVPEVSIGATPSAEFSAFVEGVTEIRPGSYVFGEINHIGTGCVTPQECSATVLTTIFSRPRPDHALCDAGSKGLIAEASHWDDYPGYGYVLDHHPNVVVHRLNEEHGWLKVSGASQSLKIGDRLRIIPNHTCPTVNLYDELVLHRGDEVLQTISVAARGKVQ
jgi:D-serine deaminase-like pyridoxal phosphate-dependent protein